jgi:hypothetical protein
MRLFIAAAIIPIICLAVPALAAPARAPARTQAQCEALSVQRLNGPGEYRHRAFIRDCVAGRVSGRLSMTYDECERLSEQRGAGLGQPGVPGGEDLYTAHETFMSDCLAGRIRRTAPPPRS